MLISPKMKSLFILLIACLLSACETTGILKNKLEKTAGEIVPFYNFSKTQLNTITLQSSANSNQNFPVALDIVFILDDKTAKELSALSGPDWFEHKQALLLAHQHKLYLIEEEVVPQTPERELNLPTQYYEAVSVFLFANYLSTQGQYQADITQFNHLHILLDRHGYALRE